MKLHIPVVAALLMAGHWMNVVTGERTGVLTTSEKKSELSSIDTALLMGGVLTRSGEDGPEE